MKRIVLAFGCLIKVTADDTFIFFFFSYFSYQIKYFQIGISLESYHLEAIRAKYEKGWFE